MKSSDSNVGFLILSGKLPLYYGACDDLFIASKYVKFDVGATVLQMEKSSAIFDTFKDVLQKLIPAGIPQYLLTHHATIFYGNINIVQEKRFKTLSIIDLLFVFLIWMCGCGIAAITLALELFRLYQLRNVIKIIPRCWRRLKIVLINLYWYFLNKCYNVFVII
jgi:hypothetical protein